MARRGSEKKKEKLNPLQEAFEESIKKISYRYGLPEAYVENQIDQEKLADYINKYASTAAQTFGEGYKPEADPNFIPEIKKYLLSGEAFSEQLKKAGSLEQTLTQNSSENRGFGQKLKEWFFGKTTKESDYNQAKFEPVDNLYELFETNQNYQALMPEVAKGLSLGAKAKYGTQVLKVAYANDMISKEKAQQGMKDSYKIMEKSKDLIGKGIESYLVNLSKLAAGVFGVLGVLIIMMQMQFTGAVVGTDLSTSWGAYYGLGLILIALVMFALLRKDLINEPKHQSKPVKKKVQKIKKSKVKPIKQKSLPKKTVIKHKIKKHKKSKKK